MCSSCARRQLVDVEVESDVAACMYGERHHSGEGASQTRQPFTTLCKARKRNPRGEQTPKKASNLYRVSLG
jgi:hypothetical protein